MKILYSIIFILLAVFLLHLTADTGYYKLQKQSIEFSGVVTWLLSDQPVPVFMDRMAGIDLKGKPAKHFYSDRRDLVGMVYHEHTLITVDWYDANGRLLGNFTESWQPDHPLPEYSIINNGRHLLAVDIKSRVRLIGSNGLVESETVLLPTIPYNTENSLFYRYLAQGEQIAAGFRHILPGNAVNSIFILSDLKGNEQLRSEFPDWQIDALNASEEAGLFCLALHKVDVTTDEFSFRTVVLDPDGRIIADLPYQHNSAFFSADGYYLLFYQNEIAWLYNLKEAKIVQKFSPGENRIFMHMIYLPEHDFVLQSGSVYRDFYGWVFRDIRLATFNVSGTQLDLLDIPDHAVYNPLLWLDQPSGQLGIGFNDGWQLYQITK